LTTTSIPGGDLAAPGPDPTPHADSAEWLRVTLSSIGDGVITTDSLGCVTFLNPVAQELTGWSSHAARGVDLREVFHIVNEDTRAQVENPALRALRDGVIVGLANHTILIARDGAERPIDDSAAPIRNAGGQTAGAVLVFRDITERKRQEDLVHDALAYASTILDPQRDPFLVLDHALAVVSANHAFYSLFRAALPDVVGAPLRTLLDGRWADPALLALLSSILPDARTFEDFELIHAAPGAHDPAVLLLNARAVRRPGNHAEHILLAMEDVTEKRRNQRLLRDSETRYRRLFQTAKDGILILDAVTGKITDANAFMSGLVGVESGGLIGKELFEIGMFTDIEENKRAFLQLQNTCYLRHDHLPIRNQRGESVEVEFVANVYHEGDRLVAQCNVRDITQRSLLEKQIVRQTEALAEQSRRKDEFLAMLSHELRNPLAPIRSAVHLLKLHEAPDADPVQRQARDIIERQVNVLTRMVSDLLEVSRVISGRIRLDLQPVDLRQIVSHALQTADPLIQQRRHTVSLDLQPDPLYVLADAARLEEVVVNLLNNAAKYTPINGSIHISCAALADQAVLAVRDSGVGVEPAILPRIFDLFTQADRSLARSAGGLGVGLSLAHRLVELHGGSIAAASDGPDLGSEFTVRLPRIPSPVGVQTRPSVEAQRHADSGAVRILIVDDNADLVLMLSSTLRHKGYSVQSAFTGPEGLALALSWIPDIALLDIGLPGLDGYDLARRLTADSRTAAVSLVALTGYGRESDVSLALEAGFDGHLLKPYDFEDLERLIFSLSKQK